MAHEKIREYRQLGFLFLVAKETPSPARFDMGKETSSPVAYNITQYFYFSGAPVAPVPIEKGAIFMNEKQRRALRDYIGRSDYETLRQFSLDVLAAYEDSLIERDLAPLSICLEEWLETLDIMAHPGTAERIRQAEKDLAEGRGKVWKNPDFTS